MDRSLAKNKYMFCEEIIVLPKIKGRYWISCQFVGRAKMQVNKVGRWEGSMDVKVGNKLTIKKMIKGQ